MDGRGRPGDSGPLDGDGRRSLYLNVRRNFLNPMFLAFDFPAPFSTMGRRNVSNVPAQALTLMNDPFVVGQARLWADRLLAEDRDGPADRRRTARAALRRRPSAARRPTRRPPPASRSSPRQARTYGESRRPARLGRPLPCPDQRERIHLRERESPGAGSPHALPTLPRTPR